MKRKTAENYLYLAHLYRILIIITNECLNCYFKGGVWNWQWRLTYDDYLAGLDDNVNTWGSVRIFDNLQIIIVDLQCFGVVIILRITLFLCASGYVRLQTSHGDLNLELHSEMVRKHTSFFFVLFFQ